MVQNERDRLRTKIQSIMLNMSSAISKEGAVLAAAVGGEENLEELCKQAEINVRRHYEQAGYSIQKAIEVAVESIQVEVKKVLQGDLTHAFLAQLGFEQKVSAHNMNTGVDAKRLKVQVDWLKNIGEQVGLHLITTSATREFVSTAGQGFLRSRDVMGSGLHQNVLAIGKFVGFKFRPFQAVGIAKNIGNAAKILGPFLAFAAVGIDAFTVYQENDREKKMADARRNITSQFQKIAKDLENQVEIQLWEFEAQVYGKIDKQIVEARQQEEEAISKSNIWMKQLVEIRKDLEEIIREIPHSSEEEV